MNITSKLILPSQLWRKKEGLRLLIGSKLFWNCFIVNLPVLMLSGMEKLCTAVFVLRN